jgi:hypothetical protein
VKDGQPLGGGPAARDEPVPHGGQRRGHGRGGGGAEAGRARHHRAPRPALPGRAVQVDPIQPTLKSPGMKPLKLEYDKPLSSFAFKFNLRRYSLERYCWLLLFTAYCIEQARPAIGTSFARSDR